MTIRQRLGAAGAILAPGAFFQDFGGALRRAVDGLMAWQERVRERRLLATLSDRLLDDMGITPADVLRETDKPFWRD